MVSDYNFNGTEIVINFRVSNALQCNRMFIILNCFIQQLFSNSNNSED